LSPPTCVFPLLVSYQVCTGHHTVQALASHGQPKDPARYIYARPRRADISAPQGGHPGTLLVPSPLLVSSLYWRPVKWPLTTTGHEVPPVAVIWPSSNLALAFTSLMAVPEALDWTDVFFFCLKPRWRSYEY